MFRVQRICYNTFLERTWYWLGDKEFLLERKNCCDTLLARLKHAGLVLIGINGRQGLDVVPGGHGHAVVQGHWHIRSVREDELDMGQMSSKLFQKQTLAQRNIVRHRVEGIFPHEAIRKFSPVCSYLLSDGSPNSSMEFVKKNGGALVALVQFERQVSPTVNGYKV